MTDLSPGLNTRAALATSAHQTACKTNAELPTSWWRWQRTDDTPVQLHNRENCGNTTTCCTNDSQKQITFLFKDKVTIQQWICSEPNSIHFRFINSVTRNVTFQKGQNNILHILLPNDNAQIFHKLCNITANTQNIAFQKLTLDKLGFHSWTTAETFYVDRDTAQRQTTELATIQVQLSAATNENDSQLAISKG